ncbi:MAG TPA: hypothetical protein VE261_07130 [Gaiellaceae bacterium]|nr:hypothetical protein [Gaiellaceae bacterium]
MLFDDATGEIITVTAISGTTLTATRGAEGTTAAAHTGGARMVNIMTKAAVDGLFADPRANANQLQGFAIDTTSPSNGDVLTYSTGSSKWTPAAAGGVTWAGDLAGSTSSSQIVVGLTGSAGTLPIAATAAILQWASGAVAPVLTQAALSSGTGANLGLQAQGGGSGTGGVGYVAGGTGSTSAGAAEMRTGATAQWRATPAALISVQSLPIEIGTGSMPTKGYVRFPNTSGNTWALSCLSTSGSVDLPIAAYNPNAKTLNLGIDGALGSSPWTNVNVWSANLGMTGDTTLSLYSPEHSIFDVSGTTEHWRYTTATTLAQWLPGANNEVDSYNTALQTTNATVTTIVTVALAASSTNTIVGTVTGRNTPTGDSFSVDVRACYKNASGTATLVGTAHVGTPDNDSGAAAWAVTWSTSGANVLLRVTGASSTTINWAAVVQAYQTK